MVSLLLLVCATGGLCQQMGGASAAQGVSGATPSIFIRILPERMEPNSISVKPGRLVIIVQNRSTAPNIKLQLDQVNGGHIKTVPMVGGQRHSLETYTLPVGDYVLSEANHREWQCKISVK